jgi:hypothetical protein
MEPSYVPQMWRKAMNKPKGNPRVTAAILEIVDNQLWENVPPETRQTFRRLLDEGHTAREAKRLIGCVVATEIYDILKHQEPFNQARFVAALHRLPTMPWDVQEA